MTRSILTFLSLALIFSSCLSPNDIVEKQDEDLVQLEQVLNLQMTKLIGKQVQKSVSIGDESEELTLTIDSLFISKEFKDINGLDITAIFQNGGYIKKSNPTQIAYTRKPSEKSGPLLLEVNKSNDQIISVTLQSETDNLIYHSSNQFHIDIDPINSTMVRYDMMNTQKVVGVDQSNYQVAGIILQ